MRVRLTMVCSGISEAVRRGAFQRGEPHDDATQARAPALAALLGRVDLALVGPAPAARRTAAALGLHAQEFAALRDLDYGAWKGRGFAEVEKAEPEAVANWLRDPQVAAPGGESFADLSRRVAAMMDAMLSEPGHTVAVTHAPVVRAAILHVVGAPLSGSRHIYVEPLSLTDFRSDGRRWVLRAAGIAPIRRRRTAGAEEAG